MQPEQQLLLRLRDAAELRGHDRLAIAALVHRRRLVPGEADPLRADQLRRGVDGAAQLPHDLGLEALIADDKLGSAAARVRQAINQIVRH